MLASSAASTTIGYRASSAASTTIGYRALVAEGQGNRGCLSKRLLSHVCANKLYDEMLLKSQDAAALTSVESRALHVPKFPI